MKTGFEMGWLVWSLVQFGYEMWTFKIHDHWIWKCKSACLFVF